MYAPSKIIKSGTSEDPDQPGDKRRPTRMCWMPRNPTRSGGHCAHEPPAHLPQFHRFADGNVLVTGADQRPPHRYGKRHLGRRDVVTHDRGLYTLASMHAPRLYHSEAMLMPDGRSRFGGGRFDDATLPTDQFSR